MEIQVQLRWSDSDQFKHVNNAVFATLFEEARARWFQSAQLGAELLNSGVVVASQTIEYKSALHYQLDPIEVAIEVSEIGASSFQLRYRLLAKEGMVVATAASVMVSVDLVSEKPKRLDDQQLSWLESHRID